MFEPAKQCPQISSISRWGWEQITKKESAEDYEDRIARNARGAARRLKKGYLDWPNDFGTAVKHPGYRLVVLQKVICCYEEEKKICQTAVAAAELDRRGWVVMTRPRATFGEEFNYMLWDMIENPGWIVIADHGLNQFCWMDDVPGQPDPIAEVVTAKAAFALRCATVRHTTLMCVRHQKSDGPGVLVRNMPPIPQSEATGYVNFNPPPGMGDMQQLFFVSAQCKTRFRPWNRLEDKAFALDEQRRSGKVALYEGLTVRFGEKVLMQDRFTGPEQNRNRAALKKEYPYLRFKKKGAKHHG